MAITGSLGFTWGAPQTLEGLMIQSESRVRLGKNKLYGSLETSSVSYTTYGIPLGLVEEYAWDLGLLSSLSMEQTPTYEQVESANVRQSGIYILTEEELTVTVGMYQYNVDILNLAFGTGNIYRFNGGQEAVMSIGDGCVDSSRPLEIATTNVYCGSGSLTGIDSRIRAILITVYDAVCTSGVPWSDINAGSLNELELEFQARNVLTHDQGNRYASIYVV